MESESDGKDGKEDGNRSAQVPVGPPKNSQEQDVREHAEEENEVGNDLPEDIYLYQNPNWTANWVWGNYTGQRGADPKVQYIRWGDSSCKIGPVSRFADIPLYYPIMINPKLVNRHTGVLPQHGIYIPPQDEMDINELQTSVHSLRRAGNPRDTHTEHVFHDFYHARFRKNLVPLPNMLHGKVVMHDGLKKIRVMEYSHPNKHGLRKWVTSGFITICYGTQEAWYPIGQMVEFIAGFRSKESKTIVYDAAPCQLVNQAGMINSSTVMVPPTIFPSVPPNAPIIKPHTWVTKSFDTRCTKTLFAREQIDVVITNNKETLRQHVDDGAIFILESLVSRLLCVEKRRTLTMEDIWSCVTSDEDKEKLAIRQKEVKAKEGRELVVFVDCDIEVQQDWLVWANQALCAFSTQTEKPTLFFSTVYLGFSFGKLVDSQNFKAVVNNHQLKRSSTVGLEKINVFEKQTEMFFSMQPANESMPTFRYSTDVQTRGYLTLSLAAVSSNIDEDTPLDIWRFDDEQAEPTALAAARKIMDEGRKDVVMYLHMNTKANQEAFHRLQRKFKLSLTGDYLPKVVGKERVVYRRGTTYLTGLSEEDKREFFLDIADLKDFYLMSEHDFIGLKPREEGISITINTWSKQSSTALAEIKKMFTSPNGPPAIMSIRKEAYRVAISGEITDEEIIKRMNAVNNTVVGKAKFKGKLMAFHAVTIADKTHKLEPAQTFNRTNTTNFTPHYTSHTVALNGFYSVLDYEHVLLVCKELEVILPTDVTLTWFKMMDDDSYLLQVQSSSENHIKAIKNKQEELQKLSIVCMDWSVLLQHNLIFVAKLSQNRKQPNKQIVITPESKAKEPTDDKSKKVVVDGNGFQTATNKTRKNHNKPRTMSNGTENKEQKFSLLKPGTLQEGKNGNSFGSLSETQAVADEENRAETDTAAEKEALSREQDKQTRLLEEERVVSNDIRRRERKKKEKDKKQQHVKTFTALKKTLGQKLSKTDRVSSESATLIDAYLEPIFVSDNGNYEQAIFNIKAVLLMGDDEMLVALSRIGNDPLASGDNRKRDRPDYAEHNESSSSPSGADSEMVEDIQDKEVTVDSPTAKQVEQSLGKPPDRASDQRGMTDFFGKTTSSTCQNTTQM
jgi:hypothetical protein